MMSWCLRKLHENGLTTLQVMKFPPVILMKIEHMFYWHSFSNKHLIRRSSQD
jgi:hypothetical protein